jgi:hypothetical protein
MDCFAALAMTVGTICAVLSHYATLMGRGLSSGTSPERIAPESHTHPETGFVHRNISRWCFGSGTRSGFWRSDKRLLAGEFLKV